MTRTADPLITVDDSVLIVIDVQDRLYPTIRDNETLLANLVKLITAAHMINLPVVLTEQQNLGPTHSDIGRALGELAPITKLEFNCFGSPEFRQRLAALNRGTIIIVGIETHICVAQTALSGVGRYRVHVVADATSSRSLSDKETALARLRHAGVVVTSLDMLIYELLQKAGTDTFRKVLTLVK